MVMEDDSREEQVKAMQQRRFEADLQRATKMTQKHGNQGSKGRSKMQQLMDVKEVDGKALTDSIANRTKKKARTERPKPNDGAKFDYDLNAEVLEEAKREHQRAQQKHDQSTHNVSGIGRSFMETDPNESQQIIMS